jgi:hypothetical protein
MAKDGIEQATKTAVTAVIGSFDKVTQDAIAISESRIGIDHTGRQNIALFIFAKLIAHCMSMSLILSNYHRVLDTGACWTISLWPH